MTMLDKKEMKFEVLNSVIGGNAVGPVNETGPLETGPIDYPYAHNTGPLGTGPLKETGPLNDPYELKHGPLMPPPNTCDPPFKTGPL